MSEERRTAPRFDRILRAQCSHSNSSSAVVTLDIGPSGVYLLTPSVPSPGELVSLVVQDESDSAAPVELTARVVRVARERDGQQLPGSALRWVKASTAGSPQFLRDYLKRLLGLEAEQLEKSDNGTTFTFSKKQ